jgi:predicted hydrocarbon binding protein
MPIVLDQLADWDEAMYGVPYRLHEDNSAFYLTIHDCLYCAEITRRSRAEDEPIPKPVCHLPVAMVAEMVEWATGQRHLVEEITCIAQGATACRFRIAK